MSAADGKEDEAPADEYSGTMDDMLSGCTYTLPSYTFEDGTTLKKVDVRYNTFGEMNATKDNIVVVCHALTGNAAVDTWWTGMVGAGCSIDTDKYMVVCANVLGSCYGSCGPMSVNPETGQQYGRDFPAVTIRDTVAVHSLMLKDGLGVHAVACVVGGSMGGMQALEWTFVATVPVRAAVVLSTGGRHTPWQIGMSELQRQAIYADPKFKEGAYDPADPPNSGLAVARQIAMVSYRTHNSYFTKFGRREQETPSIIESTRGGSNSAVQSYLKYQGEKFIERGFDANTYLALTNQMDTHDVSRGRGTYLKVLNSITIPTLIVGITSDVLYPIVEQQELAEHLGNATLKLVDSEEGQWTPPLPFFSRFFLGNSRALMGCSAVSPLSGGGTEHPSSAFSRSVASYVCHFMLTCDIPMTHKNAGHDGFLLEQSRIGPMVSQFLAATAGSRERAMLKTEVEDLKVQLAELKVEMKKMQAKI